MREKTARQPLVQQNVLDKAIAWVAPKVAQRRLIARAALASVGAYSGGGGYLGARRDRAATATWSPGGGSPTTDIIADLPELRNRSRDQMRNAPVAVGALNTAVGHIVGTGLSCTPAVQAERVGITEAQADAWNAAAKHAFSVWASSPDCDLARQCNFYGLQDLGQRTWFESGDAFFLTPTITRNGRTRLALQGFEADRVCNPNRGADTETIVDGIEISRETGEAVACYVANRHPGDARMPTSWQRVAMRGSSTGRRNVLHLMKPLRFGQLRGVPWIAPILEPLKQLNKWTDNELAAAVASSIFSVFVKMDPDAFEELFKDTSAARAALDGAEKWSGELSSSKAINLLPGEDISTATPGRPNPEFDPFWTAMVRQMGMALEIPYEVLVMHFQSSYSAARGALLMAWKFFKSRRDLLATQFCQPVYELWLADEVSSGRIQATGFFSSPELRAAWCNAIWTGDGPGSIDPDKEVKAARARVDMGISTLDAESILHDGVDWATKHKQRTKEVAAQKRDGTYVAAAGAPAPQTDDNQADDSSLEPTPTTD
jgi:lambda family phage portal protein